MAQSPIDITRDLLDPADLPPLRFDYGPDAVSEACFVVANGDETAGRAAAIPQVALTVRPGRASLEVGDVGYVLESLHWHTPSEHLVDGVAFPMELHLVHRQPETGDILVVGVLSIDGPHEPVLDSVFAGFEGFRSRACFEVPGFDLNGLLPDDMASYRYVGSLTTADRDGVFAEGVQWVLLTTPVEVARSQVEVHQRLVDSVLVSQKFEGKATFDQSRPNPPGNAREAQPVGDRRVLTDDRRLGR